MVLPFVDLLNHSLEPNIILNLGQIVKSLDKESKQVNEITVDAIALKDIDLGEQLF